MSSTHSSRSGSPTADEDEQYASDTFASDTSASPKARNNSRNQDGSMMSTTLPAPAEDTTAHDAKEEDGLAGEDSPTQEEEKVAGSTDVAPAVGGTAALPSGGPPSRRQNQTSESRRRQTASSSGGDTSLSATRRGLKKGSTATTTAPPHPVGKMLKYSSAETTFSPAHVPITEQSEKALITRLYDPEPLKKRTLMDLERRRQVQQAYDSSLDQHLSQYWDRKQQIKMRQSKKPASVGDGASARPRTTSPTQHHDDDDTAGSGTSPNRCHTSPKAGKHHSRGSPSPASSSRKGRRGYRSSSQSSTQRSTTASSSSASSRDSSPEWTEQRSSSRPKAVRSSPTFDKQGGNASSSSARGSSNKLVGPLPVSVWSIVSSFLAPTDLKALHCTARSVTADALVCGNSSRVVVLSQSQASNNSNSVTRSQRSGVFDRGDDDGFEPVTSIQRRDLTALWMVARPSSAFQRVVARFSFHHHDFNLNWMVRKGQPPATGGTINQIPLSVPSSPSSSSTDPYRLSSPRSVLVLLRNGLTLKDLVAIPLSVFYNEGSLRGLPKSVSEISFAAHEKQRQKHLAKVRRDYATLCTLISLKELTELLYRVNPDEHTDSVLDDDEEEIRSAAVTRGQGQGQGQQQQQPTTESGLSIGDPDGEAQQQQRQQANAAGGESAVRLRADRALEQQAKQQEKYMMQLTKNAELIRKRTERAREQEEATLRKQQALKLQHEEEQRIRKEKIAQRAEKLRQVQLDAKLREQMRQKVVLEKIHDHEVHQQKLEEQRKLQSLIQQEERKVINERKRERVERCEKQNDFERLCVVDKIRRKAAKIDAIKEFTEKMTLDLKHNREKASIEMQFKAQQFSNELLTFQRKCDFEQIMNHVAGSSSNNKSSSRSRHRKRIDDAASGAAAVSAHSGPSNENSSAERGERNDRHDEDTEKEDEATAHGGNDHRSSDENEIPVVAAGDQREK